MGRTSFHNTPVLGECRELKCQLTSISYERDCESGRKEFVRPTLQGLMPQSHQSFRPVPTATCWGLCWEIDVGQPLLITLLQPKILMDGVWISRCDQPLSKHNMPNTWAKLISLIIRGFHYTLVEGRTYHIQEYLSFIQHQNFIPL